MSRNYEGVIVLKTQGSEDSVDDLVSAVAREMEEEGAKLDEIKQVGKRDFAYPTKEASNGHYVNYNFAASPEELEKIQARLKLNNNVYIQHFQRASA